MNHLLKVTTLSKLLLTETCFELTSESPAFPTKNLNTQLLLQVISKDLQKPEDGEITQC